MSNVIESLSKDIASLIQTHKIPILHFAITIEFAKLDNNRIKITLECFPDSDFNDSPTSEKIDYVAMARDIANAINNLGLATEMFGLTMFVRSRDFDLLVKENPLIAARDVLGHREMRDSKLLWYIQIVRVLE